MIDVSLVVLAAFMLWVSFGLYVDSQVGTLKRVVVQRVASLCLAILSFSIIVFGV